MRLRNLGCSAVPARGDSRGAASGMPSPQRSSAANPGPSEFLARWRTRRAPSAKTRCCSIGASTPPRRTRSAIVPTVSASRLPRHLHAVAGAPGVRRGGRRWGGITSEVPKIILRCPARTGIGGDNLSLPRTYRRTHRRRGCTRLTDAVSAPPQWQRTAEVSERKPSAGAVVLVTCRCTRSGASGRTSHRKQPE